MKRKRFRIIQGNGNPTATPQNRRPRLRLVPKNFPNRDVPLQGESIFLTDDSHEFWYSDLAGLTPENAYCYEDWSNHYDDFDGLFFENFINEPPESD